MCPGSPNEVKRYIYIYIHVYINISFLRNILNSVQNTLKLFKLYCQFKISQVWIPTECCCSHIIITAIHAPL